MPRVSKARPRWRTAVRGVLLAFLAFILLFPPLYSLAVSEERGAPFSLPMPEPGDYRVLVADWGYHTAIVVEQPRGWALGPPREERAPFLEYAWGDRRYYMESDFRPHAVFATMVLPTDSVLYLDGRSDPAPLGRARSVHQRTVDAATLRTLLQELERSFRRNADGARLEPYPPVRGYRGRFYPAYGRYLWARDCNWWTVERLAPAGLARSPAGVVLSGQVPGRLQGFRRGEVPAN
ncbi:MAG TPA: DUF2459 domain-containing protein [Thermoanaerobaculia bacterium]|nr:DUF2459 domain-containing protein [Thermoanaerobaculia bacterium]